MTTPITPDEKELFERVRAFVVRFTTPYSPDEIQRTVINAKDEKDVKDIFSDYRVLDVTERDAVNLPALVASDLTTKTISLMEG